MIKTKFIRCSCGGEAIVLDKYDNEDIIYLSIWQDGHNMDNRLSWFQRLRWCWKIIRTGRPFEDQIVLDKEAADAMVEGIKELKNEKL